MAPAPAPLRLRLYLLIHINNFGIPSVLLVANERVIHRLARGTSFTSNLILLVVVELQVLRLQMSNEEQFSATEFMRQ